MVLDYNVTIHLEVLREGFAEVLSDIRRVKDFEKQVIDLYHGILGPGYNTMADVQELSEQLLSARTYMKKIEAEYAGKVQRTGA